MPSVSFAKNLKVSTAAPAPAPTLSPANFPPLPKKDKPKASPKQKASPKSLTKPTNQPSISDLFQRIRTRLKTENSSLPFKHGRMSTNTPGKTTSPSKSDERRFLKLPPSLATKIPNNQSNSLEV